MNCIECREITAKVPFQIAYALIEREARTGEQTMQAIEHIWACRECREWANGLIPDTHRQRQSRMKLYCCSAMFVAVEEASDNDFHLRLRYIRDEALWFVADNRPIGVTVIQYCPWCGGKLPSGPFTNDKIGWG